jgi:Sulfatase-modifying factor enzyme 1
MAGNVWEWTRCLWRNSAERIVYQYPYRPTDGRENPDAGEEEDRVMRGGAFDSHRRDMRCAYRSNAPPRLFLQPRLSGGDAPSVLAVGARASDLLASREGVQRSAPFWSFAAVTDKAMNRPCVWSIRSAARKCRSTMGPRSLKAGELRGSLNECHV